MSQRISIQPQISSLGRLLRRVALVTLIALLSACSSVPQTLAPSAARAAELASRGEHSASAREYDALASGAGAQADDFRLLATEQWLSANDPVNAQVSLRSVMGPLEPTARYARDLFAIEIDVLQGNYALAWQALGALSAPRGDAQTERFHALRQRTAIAVGEPVEAIRSSRQRESLARESRQVSALRTELLNQLRLAVTAGARFDPKLASRDRVARGWLEAAQLAAVSLRQSADAASQTTSAWRRRYPGHPAAVILSSLNQEALSDAAGDTPVRANLARPTLVRPNLTRPALSQLGSQSANAHIAALLPLSGRNAAAGSELRDGLISAFYQSPEDQRIPLRFYDTQREPLINLLRKATDDGAIAIIGPLLKDDVTEMARLQPTIPVLALNALADDTNVSPSNLVSPRFLQFSLAPEDEARAIAQRALAEGRTRAVAIVPSGDWGNRVLSAFQEALQSGGGELLAQERIAASDPAARELASSIQGALRIGQSLARHRQLQSELNTPLAFQPRRRGDVDFLFVPASSRLLRQVRPQLRFQAVADIPTYSVSSAWNGTADEELGNLQFVDMPWMISGADTENVTLRAEAQQSFGAGVLQSRLFAMGHDAWLLSTVMLSGSTGQGPPLNDPILGLTGELRVGADGRIARSLEWATLNRRGELILRDQMDDQSTDDLRE
ncbi:MAG: hypothetical protein EBR00_05620 [Gammaproteobacteria bacterium]|nr:hypothetical protein [Gammaproteobacteria bacterium]